MTVTVTEPEVEEITDLDEDLFDIEEDMLIEEISIDGMCGVY
ncbi:mycofactocin precursor MftA [Actinoplanes subglobosus]|uniref:Mycofactocin MftA n=1 Tax=Actinoplanes subglobosus TaxID=1547892 RepID=A0ABV8J2W8_9ACTN